MDLIKTSCLGVTLEYLNTGMTVLSSVHFWEDPPNLQSEDRPVFTNLLQEDQTWCVDVKRTHVATDPEIPREMLKDSRWERNDELSRPENSGQECEYVVQDTRSRDMNGFDSRRGPEVRYL
ncbi:unnamed protein product [Cyclocybe aegerita]|uniref:Uncharacterized protein n=1 Tax=Cyclocybe aegerita TaxID=1973307 RepID=A0A8S0VRW7_CYCAE|nr:unnamed protein product [Cyclocybe aegerita]